MIYVIQELEGDEILPFNENPWVVLIGAYASYSAHRSIMWYLFKVYAISRMPTTCPDDSSAAGGSPSMIIPLVLPIPHGTASDADVKRYSPLE